MVLLLGPVSYQVEFTNGRLCKRHLDQLLKDNSTESRFDDHQTDKDIIEFSLTETTSNSVTVENPVRRSSRVRQTDYVVFAFCTLIFSRERVL